MPALWDSGIMVREPSWHKLENAVFPEWPGFAEARRVGGLEWEPVAFPVGIGRSDVDLETEEYTVSYVKTEEYLAVCRSDKPGLEGLLAIQPSSYAIIKNSEFGQIIDDVLDSDLFDDNFTGEALFAIKGGRQVICLVRAHRPMDLPHDPSNTYQFISFTSRHDGQGGLRIRCTNVREQCANTVHLSEMLAKKNNSGWTIRHTENWQDRIAEVHTTLKGSVDDAKAWEALSRQLAGYRVRGQQTDRFLERFLPTSTAMTEREERHVDMSRSQLRTILAGPTCESIRHNGYGLVMAATEWSDHYRRHLSADSYVSRQLLTTEPHKARAISIVRDMAGIKVKDFAGV